MPTFKLYIPSSVREYDRFTLGFAHSRTFDYSPLRAALDSTLDLALGSTFRKASKVTVKTGPAARHVMSNVAVVSHTYAVLNARKK